MEAFCRQSKGRWAGQPLTLLGWQRRFIATLFGWKREDGLRRYKRAYLEVAKKNGKSTLMSATGLELLVADAEPAPEVYICAVDRDQAGIVYEEAARMVKASPELEGRLEVLASKKRLIDPINNGKLMATSADVQKQDGVNASGIIFDELHRQKHRQMWEVFEYAGASRTQPLTISITTAGESENGVWYEQRDYSDKVNAGIIPDTSHLGIVYRAMPEDDIENPRVWRKANPSMGVMISEESFRRELEEAQQSPIALANFKRLRLNLITRGTRAFVGLEDWDRGSDRPNIPPGVDCYAGADLSSVDDLTALAILAFVEDRWNLWLRFWLPADNIVTLERKHQVPYRTWADQGLIILTPGSAVDYAFIRREINEIAADRNLKVLLIDPYNATKLAIELREQDGLPVKTIRQGYLSLNAPTKELRRLIISGKLRHGGHPILRWNAINAVATEDAAGNIKLDKAKSNRKIDGLAAVVNALGAIVGEEIEEQSIYNTKDLLVL
jgi:phage terminase large subunit-like protein